MERRLALVNALADISSKFFLKGNGVPTRGRLKEGVVRFVRAF